MSSYRAQQPVVVDSKTSLEEYRGGRGRGGGGGTCSNMGGTFSSSSFSASPPDGAGKEEGDGGTIEAAGCHF
jgi:hypothetical protein